MTFILGHHHKNIKSHPDVSGINELNANNVRDLASVWTPLSVKASMPVAHVYSSINWAILSSDNNLPTVPCRIIIWSNVDSLSTGFLKPWNSTEISTKIQVQGNAYECIALQWRHNGCDGVSNRQPYDCLLNCLFRHRSNKTSSSVSLAFVRGIHRWPVNSPHKWPVTRKIFPFDDNSSLRVASKMYLKRVTVCSVHTYISPCCCLVSFVFLLTLKRKFCVMHVITISLCRDQSGYGAQPIKDDVTT